MQTSVTSQSPTKGKLWNHRSVITSVRRSVPTDPATSILIFGVTTVFLFLLFRNLGLHASIFGDEWSYSFFSRLAALSAAPTSNYIYLSLFRLTRAFGSGFLESARIINSLLFVSSSIFVYWTARQVATKP